MTKMNPVNQERLEVADVALSRLMLGLKQQNTTLRGKDLERIKLVEQSLSLLQTARIV